MKINTDWRLRRIAGECVLINEGACDVDIHHAFSLSSSAAWLFERIGDSDVDEGQMLAWLVDEYDADEALLKSDLDSITGLWMQYGILV